ncbi:hypothetical protein [Streptomyces sp. NPDC058694]|uniref:hypothetical protein n=1 Tax=Streptomyces sp. NPDC058694 TaxID=3346603 RepID=UPI00364EEFB1
MFFAGRVPLERVVSRLGEPYVDPASVGHDDLDHTGTGALDPGDRTRRPGGERPRHRFLAGVDPTAGPEEDS